MRCLIVVFAFAGVAFGQGLTEYGAAAAGGAVGTAAGKKVSDGITSIFGKVDQQTKDAAKGKDKAPAKQKPTPAVPPATSAASASSVTLATSGSSSAPSAGGAVSSPSPVRSSSAKPRPARSTVAKVEQGAVPVPDHSVDSVPPPPTIPVRRTAVVVRPVEPPQPVVEPVPVPAPPPPPQMSEENLKSLEPGTSREELLKLGVPSSRITMTDGGHLLEIYHYASREASLGIVRLNDGAVDSVELR